MKDVIFSYYFPPLVVLWRGLLPLGLSLQGAAVNEEPVCVKWATCCQAPVLSVVHPATMSLNKMLHVHIVTVLVVR